MHAEQPELYGYPTSEYRGLSLEAIASQLEERQWSHDAFRQYLPEILACSDDLIGTHRLYWLLGLREEWRRCGWAMSGRERELMFCLALRWNDWPLLLAVAEGIEALRPLHPTEGIGCCQALWHMGQTESALNRCRRLNFAQPGFDPAQAMLGALNVWNDTLQHHPFSPLLGQPSGPLRLEPLGHHHLTDFAWQYFDPSIAERCNLPTFESGEHWHRWLQENESYGDECVFAVLHQSWGFLGSVSLVLHEGVGFVSYWIGVDFQGHGMGTQAVSLLLEMAHSASGMHTCYAQVLECNWASRRILEKLGFEQLCCRLAPPNEDGLIYRLGSFRSYQQNIRELHWLFECMQSDTKILMYPCEQNDAVAVK